MVEWLQQGAGYLAQIAAAITAAGVIATFCVTAYRKSVKEPIGKSSDAMNERIERIEDVQKEHDERLDKLEGFLHNDNRAIKELERTCKELTRSTSLTLKSQMALLDVQLQKTEDPVTRDKLESSLNEIHDHLLERV